MQIDIVIFEFLGKEFDQIAEQFKRRGLKIRYGRWTIQEKQTLHQNFEDFVKENEDDIGNPVDFIVAADDKSRAHEVIQ